MIAVLLVGSTWLAGCARLAGADPGDESQYDGFCTPPAPLPAVVVTDYEGGGTPGVETFGNRIAQGHALLDAACAALHLPGTSLDPHGPVALWGYSQALGRRPVQWLTGNRELRRILT